MAVNARATQDFVPIKEVRDGVIILKDGGMRAVLLASSVNLSLKSYDEQKAVLLQFQTFLNSIDFPIQITIESRRLDIRPYLSLLENRMKEQLEPLLKIQTREYVEFIRSFTETVNIMSKSFFVVVPYSGAGTTNTGIMASFMPKKKESAQDKGKDDATLFEEKRSQLEQRIGVVSQGLSRVGIRTVQLGTEEVIELFYKVFNPGETTASAKIDLK